MFRIARGGANAVVIPLSLALLTAGLAAPLGRPELLSLSAIPFAFGLLAIQFYRDPDRGVASGIVSPADGKVIRIDQVDDPELGPCDRLCIFMSPLNVHVNRAPASISIRKVTHFPGKHRPAFNKDSDLNERRVYLARTTLPSGEQLDLKIIQIAGAMARRTLSYVEPGDGLAKGDRLGMIQLGSRTDLLIPKGRARFERKVGDRVQGSRVRLGDWL